MARTLLTDVAVRRLGKPSAGRLEVWDRSLPGFGLRITHKDHRSFVLLTRLHGKPIRVTLGAVPATSLATARQRAKEALDRVARGEDPRLPKREPRKVPGMFAHVADEFIEKHAKLKKRSWPEDRRMFDKYILPRWKDRRLDHIERADVTKLLEAIVKDNGPTQANRVLALVKKTFSWALNGGLIAAHPAAGYTPPGPKNERDRVLTDDEITALWKTWDAMAYPWGVSMQLILLTATRRGEVEGMRWDEIDHRASLWGIPAERTKGKMPLVLPLSTPARERLARVPRFEGCPFVFTTTGKGPIRNWSDAVDDAREQSGVTGWTIHDLRRTARTKLPQLGIAADVAERCLGHKIGGVRGVYDRYDYLAEKRDALERWGAHVITLVTQPATELVAAHG